MSTDTHLNRIMLRSGVMGVLVVAGSVYWQSWSVSLGAAAGVVLALANFYAQRRLVGRMISEGKAGSAGGLFVVKLGVLFGVLWLLIAVARLNAIAVMAGFSVLVVAITTGGTAAGDDEEAPPTAETDGEAV